MKDESLQIPAHLDADEVLKTIDKIVDKLAGGFVFGYYGIEDIKQEARIMGIKGLKDYDPSRKLENFLHTHIKNRLINFKRDNYKRTEAPCKPCHIAKINSKTPPHDGSFCAKYLKWAKNNFVKKNLMEPLDINYICDEEEPNTRVSFDLEEESYLKEMYNLIDEHLDVELRKVYLKMKAGQKVSKALKERVIREIKGILCQNAEDSPNENESI